MSKIKQLRALEILDSRGRPTVQATCVLHSGAVATASVPSGASTGAAEAWELRDGDPKRYRGLGCRRAVENINQTLNDALKDRTFDHQRELDSWLIETDGTPNKARLGANALLAVSISGARAVAAERGLPLYQHFADMAGLPLRQLPRPTINLFSGGKHAGGQTSIQDVLVVPMSATTMDEALAMTYDVYQAAAGLILRKYKMRMLRADEGGLAPDFPSTEAMLQDAVEAIQAAGYEADRQISLAVDVASSQFYADSSYLLDGRPLSSAEMIGQLAEWMQRYPLISIEDGLAEEDWTQWPELRARLEGDVLILGDDFLCTNPARIRRAVKAKAANALLLKVNQIGTLTEANEAASTARAAGWHVTVSARSGETEDNWLADLAVGWCGDHIKIGSITQSERLAKYNRLLAIEADTQLPLATERQKPSS
jgi:enolase